MKSSWWAGARKAATYSSPRTVSATGVESAPDSGLMSPQGSVEAWTGVPRDTCQSGFPLRRSNAYAVSCWVTTITRPPTTSGDP